MYFCDQGDLDMVRCYQYIPMIIFSLPLVSIVVGVGDICGDKGSSVHRHEKENKRS